MELDALQRICDITVGCRNKDSDQVPLHKFYEYYFEGIALWANLLQQKDCMFKKLVQMNGLFVPRFGGEQNELIYSPDQTNQAQALKQKAQSINGSPRNQNESIDDNQFQLKRVNSIEEPTVEYEKKEELVPKIEVESVGSFLRMPELNQMFK